MLILIHSMLTTRTILGVIFALHYANAVTNAPRILYNGAFVSDAPIIKGYRTKQLSYRSIFDIDRPLLMTNMQDDNNNDRNQSEKESFESQIDTFLDTQLFDPDSDSNVDNWFANLVKSDYDTAEALYVGIIGIVGVIASQEALRVVKYGADNYVPFGHSSSLF